MPTIGLKQIESLIQSLSIKSYEEYENTDLFDVNNNDNEINLNIFNNLTSNKNLRQTLNTFNSNFDFI